MTDYKIEVQKAFGEKLRMRVSGICIHKNKILLVKHEGLGEAGYIWSPPGGGLHYNESVTDGLKREFLEETGLEIAVKDFLFVNEYHHPPLHAVELFFLVDVLEGTLMKGTDPELTDNNQIISEIKYISFDQIDLFPKTILHNIFSFCEKSKNLINLRGYYYCNK